VVELAGRLGVSFAGRVSYTRSLWKRYSTALGEVTGLQEMSQTYYRRYETRRRGHKECGAGAESEGITIGEVTGVLIPTFVIVVPTFSTDAERKSGSKGIAFTGVCWTLAYRAPRTSAEESLCQLLRRCWVGASRPGRQLF